MSKVVNVDALEGPKGADAIRGSDLPGPAGSEVVRRPGASACQRGAWTRPGEGGPGNKAVERPRQEVAL